MASGRKEELELTATVPSEAPDHEGTFGASNEEGDYCRICRGEAADELPLFYPCKCSGSIKFVHQDCLMEWLSHSQKKYCELCKTPFRFTKLYDHRMPHTLPLPVFFRRLCLHGVRTTFKWIRYLLVGLVWLGWLPWSIRQVWRGLFWLADGSWASVTDMDGTAPSTFLPDPTAPVNTTTARSLNGTEVIVNALPGTFASISSFLRYSSSDFLLVKIIRFLYPNLFNWSAGFIARGSPSGAALLSTSDRQPSLLSDVGYLKALTSSQTINNCLTDVLEGQIICLLIVAAFILVFLIREWVINQQPAADLPGANPAEDVRLDGGDGALREPAGRRRRWVGEEGREERIRRIAVPRPRRRIAAPEVENASDVAPQMPSIERFNTNDTEISDMASPANEGQSHQGQPPPEDDQTPQEAFTATRPTLQTRNAFEDAPSIRRSIEEGIPTRISPEWPGLEIFKDLWNRADRDPAEVLRIIREEDRVDELAWIVAKMEKLQQKRQLTQRQPGTPLTEVEHTPIPNVQHVNEGPIDENTGSAGPPDPTSGAGPAGEASQPAEAQDGTHSIHNTEKRSPDSWDLVELTETPDELFVHLEGFPNQPDIVAESPRDAETPETVEENLMDQDEASSTGAALGTPDTTPQGSTDDPDHPATAAEALADWLWRTEEYIPQAENQIGEDDEHVVEDVNQEAPFVPAPPAEIASDGEDEAEAEEEQNPEVVAAAAAAGIDLNNPEAIEDAEDLDGILELIGMQGPLTGMLQNVIFSEFLITLTLAASVWLPYIWGKIALLLLANPFGVFVRAPLHLLSNLADTAVDISLFISGISVYVLNCGIDFLVYLVSFIHPISHPWINNNSVGRMSLTLAAGSGTRLEKAIFGTVGGLKPDLPTFSVLSHQALRVFQRRVVTDLDTVGQSLVYLCYELPLRLHDRIYSGVGIIKYTASDVSRLISTTYQQMVNNFGILHQGLRNLRSLGLGVNAPLDTSSLDYSLVRWSAQDRTIAVVLGYAFFAVLGYLYIKTARLLLGIHKGERVEGVIADSLNQAGGVMKVILIIGIEMMLFPLYCGFLLDVALMPLFEGVGFQSRLAFLMSAPMTALFVHWFVGTCYMFHFALFVSMCRKIMRRGVLYFIRDPDDPTFHPVRDVLERPIATQLSKIAFSGLVYGGLVILCLGGIVWVVSRVEGIFPIHWTSNEPILEFPIDLLFYKFLLPILTRSVEPSKKLNAMYDWWFRKCARWLRLTNFLFNEQKDDEQGRHVRRTWAAIFQRKSGDVDKPVIGEDRRILAEDRQLEAYFLRDGTFVRAPGSDSVRVPKGGRVFLEVDEGNNRTDGEADVDDGPHGRTNDNFVKVYIPPMFRARIAAFVVYIWAFAAVTGIIFTLVPLSLGRKSILLITQSSQPPNDLYAFSVGLYLCGSAAYAFSYYQTCRDWVLAKVQHYFKEKDQALPRLWSSAVYFSGLAYMGVTFGFILPFLFSTLVELYFVTPLHTYLASTYTPQRSADTSPVLPPTIHVMQTWILGLVYLRAILRFATNHLDAQTRAATAIRSISRQGFWQPDVRLATRAFVLPSLVVSFVLLLTPLGLGWAINTALREPVLQAKIYQYAYPGILGFALAFYCALLLKRQVGVWRTRIRDDVYLIGERLHNFGESQRWQNKGKGKVSVGDRAVSERLQIR